jgi:hypothetical protein
MGKDGYLSYQQSNLAWTELAIIPLKTGPRKFPYGRSDFESSKILICDTNVAEQGLWGGENARLGVKS